MAMLPVLLLAACTAGGAGSTLLLRLSLPWHLRLAVGVCLGQAQLGLVGFLWASFFGFDGVALAAAAILAAAPATAFAFERLRPAAHPPALGTRIGVLQAAALLLLAAALLAVTRQAIHLDANGLATGVEHNLGDLPFHLAVITNFTQGDNFPPEHPELAGERLTYPFLADFVAALLVRSGADWAAALHLQDGLLILALLLLLYDFGAALTRDRRAALLVPLLVFCSGGLGFALLFQDAGRAASLPELLANLPRNYTIQGSGPLRWGNLVTTLLVPQRALLMGLPLAVWVWTLWWRALAPRAELSLPESGRLMRAAGWTTGLLPLVHTHSFAVCLALATALAVQFRQPRLWRAYFTTAILPALPQVVWMAVGSSLRASSFLAWHVGWDRGGENPVVFWLRNTGLLIPLLALTCTPLLRHRRPTGLLRFYVPFALCFVIPNLFRLSPWIWDNVKFLLVWFIASTPLVALALVHLGRAGPGRRLLAAALTGVLTLAGALDLWRVASGQRRHRIFSPAALAFAREITAATPPEARLAHLPAHDSPALLAGRRSLLGYPGHIWSQGLTGGSRQDDLARIYAGHPRARALLRKHALDYVLLGPAERRHLRIDEGFLRSFPIVTRSGAYQLFDVRGRRSGP